MKRIASNKDAGESCNRAKCFECLFPPKKLREVNVELQKFCTPSNYFSQLHVIEDMNTSDP